MKASIRRNYCSPSQIGIEQVERPFPKVDEVLIRIHACTVNRTDCANLTAKPFIMRFILGLFKPKNIIIGTDFAGEVISIGQNVKSFNIGDRVFGFNDQGMKSQAEYLTVRTKDIYSIPKNINYKQAAASLEGAHYAYSFIHKVNIKSGQSVFINGASGGIGSALTQFVRQYNVKITATCDTKNISLIKSYGVDKIIDYTREDFRDTHIKYDIVFDAVGKSTFGDCKSLLNEKGVYLSSELGPYLQNIYFPLLTSMLSKKVIFPIPYSTSKTIPYICNHLESKKYKPFIDREYSLEDISKAYEYVIKGQKTGSVLIDLILKNVNTH